MPLSPRAEQLRVVLYRHLAETGLRPPRDSALSGLGTSAAEVDAALSELQDAHHLVHRDGRIVLAHPFATRNFGFSVMSATTLWWGGCAWDAFAIPHLVPNAGAVLVATTCPGCATAHAWTVTSDLPPAGEQVAHFLTPAAQIWDDVVHACEHQRIFCSEHCVDAWLQSTGHARGFVMSLNTLWHLAARWYEGRLHTPYQRREPAQAAEYFASVGLTGPFWQAT